jgi:hypothetical protein
VVWRLYPPYLRVTSSLPETAEGKSPRNGEWTAP